AAEPPPRGVARPGPMKALCLLALGISLICATASAARADVAYEVEIAGVEDDTLASALRDNSQLVKLKDRQPPSIAALRRRADDDVPRLLQLLHDSGYWTAAIEVAIDDAAQPVKVTLRTNPGPLFHLAGVEFAAAGGGKLPEGLDAAAVGLA